MALPIAISQPPAVAAIPLPIAPRSPGWRAFVIAAGLAASVAWTGLLIYLAVALVRYAVS
jgi:acyl-CoA synthetase (NDP forming)